MCMLHANEGDLTIRKLRRELNYRKVSLDGKQIKFNRMILDWCEEHGPKPEPVKVEKQAAPVSIAADPTAASENVPQEEVQTRDVEMKEEVPKSNPMEVEQKVQFARRTNCF